MLVGYNTNISYKGTVYHVQTEDSGVNNPVIVTLLYVKGTILASKKTNYAHIVGDPDFREKARALMKEQHKKMLKELIAGKHTGVTEQQQPQPEAVSEEMPAAGAPQEAQTIAQESPADAVTAAMEPALPGAAHGPETTTAGETAGAETPAAPPLSAEEVKKRQLSKSLDDILLDYILKREE